MRLGGWAGGGVLLALALAACSGGDSTGTDTGSLEVAISGLPGGVDASVSVTGPGGYSRALVGSETLTGLEAGSYTVAAAVVADGGAFYAASPASQTVTVSGGSTAGAAVSYQVATSALSISITGLPSGTEAAVDVSGPGGFYREFAGAATINALLPGTYTLVAHPVAAGGTSYAGTSESQEAVVAAGGTTSVTVAYVEAPSAGLNLRIDGVHLTQSVQTYTGDVPLVANRDALLRVFVTASEANSVSPSVRVRFYHGGVLASEQTITRSGATPLAPRQGTLGSSWNLAVSGALMTENLSILVDVDPANGHAETNEADNAFPASGTPLALQVEGVSPFRVTLVPIRTNVDGRTGNVTAANLDQYLATAMRMHPLSSHDAVLGAQLTIGTNVPALQSGNGNNSWNTILGELQARRTSDGSTRYYYGVVNPNYSSGVAGMGFIGHPVAIGWDKLPSGAAVAAHEWGHNWDRGHAPCGTATNPDVNYPYAGGTIGVYGYDVAADVLKPTSSHDIMGYCNNEWISDYTYRGVMQYRSAEPAVASALGQAIQPTLVVWGRIVNGQPVLEPAFQATTRPSLPRNAGPYTLEARAADGARVFSFGFSALDVADDPNGGKHFAFAVPLAPERHARIEHLRLSAAGAVATLARSGQPAAEVRVSPAGAGRVAIRWDPARSPMVVVRDRVTGEVLSFARGGHAEVAATRPDLSLTVSDRIRSRDVLVRVPGR